MASDNLPIVTLPFFLSVISPPEATFNCSGIGVVDSSDGRNDNGGGGGDGGGVGVR